MPRPKKEQPNRADGLYEVKITIGKTFQGKLIRKSFYSSVSKDDAKKQAEQFKIEQEVANRTDITEAMESKNFAKWAKEWLLSIKGTVKDSTYHLTYTNSVDNHLTPYFGKMSLSEIKQIHVQSFFNDEAKRFSKETQKKVRMCLSAIFESAINNELIFRNPCHNIKLSEKDPTAKNIYTKDEVALLLNFAATHRYGPEITVLLTYGIRRGELLGLRWDDLDFENRVIHIRHAVSDVQNAETQKMEVIVDDPKTAFSARDLPMSKEIESLLKARPRSIVVGYNEHKKKNGKMVATDFVFYNQLGQMCSPRTWSRRHYDVFMEEMHNFYLAQDPPIDVPKRNPHELRHTRATLWVNDDKNLFAIAGALGWGDLKMLRQRYAHADVESMRKSLEL